MNSPTPRIAAGIGILLLIGILIQFLYDPISSARHALEVSNARDQLPQARAKWGSSGITDYTFEIRGDARSICQPSAIIQVKNDIVVKVETKDFSSEDALPQRLSPGQWADPDWGNEIFLCNYNHFTVTRIFTLVAQTLQNFPSSLLQADFDPAYGFVTNFRYGIYIGYGLLRPQIGDCCSEFNIRNFKPTVEQ